MPAFDQDVETRLWIPGTRAGDRSQRAVALAVKEYDESFNLARHEVTGDWVVVIGENGFPVFGFGRELPEASAVERLLGEHDIKRHGSRMLDHLNRENARKQAETENRISEANGVLAERFEHARRQEVVGRRSAGGLARGRS